MAGPRNATTNSDSGIRTYRWGDKDYPSVTSLRRIAGVPFGLAAWQVNQVLAAALDNVDVLGMMKTNEGEDAARKWLRAQANLTRDAAASKGTAVHEAAAAGIDPALAPPDITPYLVAYNDFLDRTEAKVLLSERQVWNTTMGYAGSLDLLLSYHDNGAERVAVADIKTGKGLYADHALQLVAYAMGEFVGEDNKVDLDATALLHKASRLAVLHLTDSPSPTMPHGWELVEIEPTPALFAAYTNMTEFAQWLIAHPSIDPLITRRITK